MFIQRSITEKIRTGAKQSPVIAIIGPRQSGKSTLAKELFPKHIYIDMQDAEMQEFAHKDPKGFLSSFANKHGIIIDEAQFAPQLFSQIKVEADKNPQAGYYILSGSQNFLLHEKISESLAGRVYFYILLPLSISELKQADLLEKRPEDQILKGFYPRVYQPHITIQEYYHNYISTYVERDIRSVRNVDNMITFNKFLKLCALQIGTTINFSNLAVDAGVSVATAKSWLSLLETSFILYLLPTYHENLGKRITKSPKLYFYDTGLAATLIDGSKDLIIRKRDLYGALFENMIISDLLKNFNSQAIRYTCSFYRDTNKNEIDLIVEAGGKVIPIEIKSSETMSSHYFDTLAWFNQQTQNTEEPVVIYGGTEMQKRSRGRVLSWENTDLVQVDSTDQKN